jgi:hypothetical protein
MIRRRYFEWLVDKISGSECARQIPYRRLLECLHEIDFRWTIPNDANRAEDGLSLRYRFAREDADLLQGPCSVLEMMVALAICCEESIMDDPAYGDRTSQWFWGMIVNLGLGAMTDDMFDRRFVEDVIEDFLDRNYEPDGRGGLFTVKNCTRDLRTVEIWYQCCWYLDDLI